MKRIGSALMVAIASLVVRTAGAEDRALDLDGLAEQVAKLRSEIEVLDARAEEQKENRRARLRGLAVQKSSLETDLQREELRAQQLAERLERGKHRTRDHEARESRLESAVLGIVDRVKHSVARGVPFSPAERTAELDAIARELDAGSLAATAAIDRLWSWVDAELALTKEVGMRPQSILIDGSEQLADVAHLGMVSLYFRAPGGRFGAARQVNDSWIWEVATAPQDQERIAALFDALEHGAPSGSFVLPGAVHAELKP